MNHYIAKHFVGVLSCVFLGYGYVVFQLTTLCVGIPPVLPANAVVTPAEVKQLAQSWDAAPVQVRQKFIGGLLVVSDAAVNLRPTALGYAFHTAKSKAWQEATVEHDYLMAAAVYIANPKARSDKILEDRYAAFQASGTTAQVGWSARERWWDSSVFLALLDIERLI